MMFGLPWWIYMLIVLIFFSGYMAFRAIRAEKQLEQHSIEREGTVYMERIAYEKQLRQADNNQNLTHDEHVEDPVMQDSVSVSESESVSENDGIQEETDADRNRHVSV